MHKTRLKTFVSLDDAMENEGMSFHQLIVCGSLILSLACAEADPRAHQAIIQMDMRRLVDGSVVTSGDAGVEPQPTLSRTTRDIWVVYSADRYTDGVRAQLDPTHRALMTSEQVIEALNPQVIVLEWTGPSSVSDQRLTRYLRMGDMKVIPFFTPPENVSDESETRRMIEDKARYLLAHHGDAKALLRQNERLVLGLDWSHARQAGAEAFVDAISQTGQSVLWAGPMSGSAAFGPDVLYRWNDCTVDSLRSMEVDGVNVVCVSHPGWKESGATPFSMRSLEARRVADRIQSPLMVYGVSAWSDDRQLDAVDGVATDQPSAITGGVSVHPYHTRRLEWAQRLGLMARAYSLAELVDDVPQPLYGRGDLSMSFEDAVGLSIVWRPSDAAAEWLLNVSPMIVPADSHVVIEHIDPGVGLTLVFADGERVDVAQSGVSESLSSEGPRRLEDLIFVYQAVDGRTELSLSGVRFVSMEE